MSERILIVDDTPANIQMLMAILKEHGYQLSAATNGRQALEVIERVRPDLVLMDVLMPEMDGYEACRQLKASPAWRDLPIIFLTAKTDTADVVRGFELGAVDYVGKPFNAHELLARVSTHLTLQRLRLQMAARNAELARELEVAQEFLTEARRRVDGALLGESPAIRALRESILDHAKTVETLLLTGPQGGAHEATARAIHHGSPRSQHAFIHVNCGLLPPGQDPGIVSPRATGAGARLSLLELADKGTLYLEELHRLPAEMQGRLAEVLEGLEAVREAGQRAAPDVRVIAYTSAVLAAPSGFHPKLQAVLERKQMRVPALAERSQDVPEQASFFLRQHARRIGSVVETISPQSMKRLCKYRWPGDVSELQSVIERAVTSAREPVLEIDAGLLDEGLPLGLYRLIEKLGEGGMGEVWRARHQLLARPCAVKLIRPDLLGEKNREARDRALPARSSDDCPLELTEHRAPLRLRRERDRQLLLRHGIARRRGPQLAGGALRAASAGAGGRRAAPSLSLARRGPRGGTPPSRHQAPQSLPVPAWPRFRRCQGAGLRPRQVAA